MSNLISAAVYFSYTYNYHFSSKINPLFIKVCYENESEIEIEAESVEVDGDDLDDEFEVPTQQERRSITKKKWVTPRLCAALDKAKVKRMRLKN